VDLISAVLDMVDRESVPPADWIRLASRKKVGWKEIESAVAGHRV
jgi:hypothetical protein